jgi:uncharacterized protein YdaU (DUF1376 family)
MNFYPFHIGDYTSHTYHLEDYEDLAYRRMIDLYYLNEQPFSDAKEIARKVKTDVDIVENLLKEFFVLEDDGCWHNKRADIEIAKYQFIKDSGKKGADKRWGNREEKVSQCDPNSPPNAIPIATKTITKTNTNIKTLQPEGFDLFWNAYDKKVGKPNAIKQWQKIKPDAQLIAIIINKAKADKIAKPDNKYRKDPERWLKGQHWLDEVIVEQATKPKELPLGTEQQIEEAYRVECGGDPRLARFNSYFEMRKFIINKREERTRT